MLILKELMTLMVLNLSSKLMICLSTCSSLFCSLVVFLYLFYTSCFLLSLLLICYLSYFTNGVFSSIMFSILSFVSQKAIIFQQSHPIELFHYQQLSSSLKNLIVTVFMAYNYVSFDRDHFTYSFLICITCIKRF